MSIRIVLVGTTHPGNIGAVARAMKNMGISDLALVNPRYFPDKEATARASGAEDVLERATVTEDLRDAIADEPQTRLRYQCSPYYTNTALYPPIEQFELAAGFVADDTIAQKLDKMEILLGQALDDISEVAPLFAATLSLDFGDRYPPIEMSPQQQKKRTLLAMIEQVEAFGELCRRTAYERMAWLDGELAGREHIAGAEFTIADITAVCAFGIGRVAKIRIPEELENLTRWHERVSARPSEASTSSTVERVARITSST